MARSKSLNLGQRHRLIRTSLTGPNGKALLDYLMDEYVFGEVPTTDPTKLAMDAGARALVLSLHRVATTTDEEPQI